MTAKAKESTKDKIVGLIEKMSVIELKELVDELQEKFGVTAAQPVSVNAGAATAEAAQEEEKTEFDVILKSFGESKLAVIKEVRALTNLGLKEAKELVESAPKTIKESVAKEEANQIKERIEKAGGVIEIK